MPRSFCPLVYKQSSKLCFTEPFSAASRSCVCEAKRRPAGTAARRAAQLRGTQAEQRDRLGRRREGIGDGAAVGQRDRGDRRVLAVGHQRRQLERGSRVEGGEALKRRSILRTGGVECEGGGGVTDGEALERTSVLRTGGVECG